MAVPLSIKVALILLGVGTILFIVGFSTDKWVDYKVLINDETHRMRYEREVNFGLWRYCIHDKVTTNKYRYQRFCFNFLSEDNRHPRTNQKYQELTGEQRATQFFETAALLMVIPAFLLLILGAFVEALKNKKLVPILAGVVTILAAGSVFLGAIIFGSWDATDGRLDWSFAITVVGGVFFFFSGAATIAGVILKK